MGYHVNLYKQDNQVFTAQEIETAADILIKEFRFEKTVDNNGEEFFFYPENDDWVVFGGENFWINTTDDDLIAVFVRFADKLGSNYYVIGDEGEIYTIDGVEYPNDDEEISKPEFSIWNWLQIIILICLTASALLALNGK
ncbi:hypothetical protein ACOR62_07250 [Neisseria lisongii]|uniref:SMI1/KNR4 family protein n=1 Tax=Neisseria lisongii TaxID=2912188 RepID=A0AAW5APL1_9NEIS|nr:hypothetical protein [Neisseria lisongii]MCF7530376.1 hypothetical protein [Neisseria lisongii]